MPHKAWLNMEVLPTHPFMPHAYIYIYEPYNLVAIYYYLIIIYNPKCKCFSAYNPKCFGAYNPKCFGAYNPKCKCFGAYNPKCFGAYNPKCMFWCL